MNKEANKFDALAYGIGVLGPPGKVSENRRLEASQGVFSDAHMWALPERSGRLVVHEWSDGDQTTTAGVAVNARAEALP